MLIVHQGNNTIVVRDTVQYHELSSYDGTVKRPQAGWAKNRGSVSGVEAESLLFAGMSVLVLKLILFRV
jgi:hypothetical protein